MSRLPNSPLDKPVLPPLGIRFPFWLKWGVVGLVIGGMVAAIFPNFIRRSKCGLDQTEEVSNLRQIGIALYEFETEYGRFPDETTIDAVRLKTGNELPPGTKTSNDYFRQLIASGVAQTEFMFYARTRGCKKPDNDFSGNHALSKGECGFTYLGRANPGDLPARPQVVAPMIPGTDRFDPKPFKGKAVILTLDNIVSSLPIDQNGHVIIAGRNMMDPNHPIWEGHAPGIGWPDL